MLRRLLIVAIATVAGTAGFSRQATAAPTPSLTPQTWQLDFQFEDPQRLVVQLPGEAKPRVYWYILYNVVNNSGKDVQFLPRFEIVTNDLKVVTADPATDPVVFATIKKLHAKDRPFLLEPLEATGKLLQGSDNAKDSVAIWRDFSGQTRRFTMFVGGLSGDNVVIPNPTFDPSKPETEVREGPKGQKVKVTVNPRRFTLYKTLSIVYTLPGDDEARKTALAVRGDLEWVMR
jgi:hypothetical protein